MYAPMDTICFCPSESSTPPMYGAMDSALYHSTPSSIHASASFASSPWMPEKSPTIARAAR